MKKTIFRTIGVLLFLLVAFVVNAAWFKPLFIRTFYERVFIEFAFDSPELLSGLHLVEQFGVQAHNKKLNDLSEAEATRQAARLLHNLDVLHSYDVSGMDQPHRLSYDVLD